jgi:probable rRNA maturation factor
MIVIQNSIDDVSVDEPTLCNIMQTVIEDLNKGDSELVIRFVNKNDIRILNNTYRQQDKTTNVLSFGNDLPIEIDEQILGDVVICTEVVLEESIEQNKNFKDHLVHMAVHGTLHLLGFDHDHDDDAVKMESAEITILEKIGISNPY